MKRIELIDLGVGDNAKKFLEKNVDGVLNFEDLDSLNENKMIDRRTGDMNNIKLYKYRLKDGTCATEFVQLEYQLNDRKKILFRGLMTEEENFIWPMAGITQAIRSSEKKH